MDSYEVLLDRLTKNLPQKTSSGERFEIPVFTVVIVGTKTLIKNFEDVAGKLRRPKEVLAKFLFKELATPGLISGQELVLQAKLQPRLVQEKLESFVERTVLCKECGKPDTHLEHLERNLAALICEACGARRPVRV
jgi:translation initiation factor 2 subunit 2